MKILIIPCNQKKTAKSYPYWDELIRLLQNNGHIITIINDILQEELLKKTIEDNDIWMNIDSFIQHFVKYHNLKPGVVIWGKSDPNIFGYKENLNILKSRENLRKEQFRWWVDEPFDKNVFTEPEEIIKKIENLIF